MGLCAATTLQDDCSPTSFNHFIVHSVLNVFSKLVSGFFAKPGTRFSEHSGE